MQGVSTVGGKIRRLATLACISKICNCQRHHMDLVKFQVALLAAHPPDNVKLDTLVRVLKLP
jgi:hypothetical protein